MIVPFLFNRNGSLRSESWMQLKQLNADEMIPNFPFRNKFLNLGLVFWPRHPFLTPSQNKALG